MAGEALDRAAERRGDREWIAALLRDPRTRVLRVDGESVPIADSRLVLADTASLPAAGDAVLLGLDSREHAVFAAPGRRDASFVHLRDVAAELPADQSGLAAHAVALLAWHRRHPHCAVCGAPTEMVEAGYMRRCTNPDDGSLHHPRTDPCVIVLVHHGDRVLLGRRPSFPPQRFSVLAGFVEPGESLEAAVAREVAEESGIVVDPDSIRYVASQPWPFPASLMLGFTAAARRTTIAPRDGELAEVRWIARDELLRAIAVGDLVLPPPASIARHLVEAWLGTAVT